MEQLYYLGTPMKRAETERNIYIERDKGKWEAKKDEEKYSEQETKWQ